MSGAGPIARLTDAARLATLGAALLAPTAIAAPQALDETALDLVRAGTVEPAHGVHDASTTSTPGRDALAIGHADLALDRRAAVTLSGDAQRGLRAASVANVAGSDASAVINVLGADAWGGASAFVAGQRNDLAQLEHRGGFLPAQWLPGGPDRRRHSLSTRTIGQWHRAASDAVVDRASTHRLETHQVNARVPGFSPARDWEVNLDLGTMPTITVPGFGFDWTAGKEPFRYGVAADFSRFGLGGAGLSLGNIRADGDDLVIAGGSITLPEITLPSVTGELCAFTCWRGEVSGTRIESQTLSLDVGDIRLAGANPFKDIDLQLGQGIAAVGSGTFAIQGIGAEVTAELSFQLPSIGGQSITLDLVPSLSFMSDEALSAARKVLPDTPSVTIDLPEIDLPSGSFEVTLVDVDAPTYAGSFGFSGQMEDAVICLALMSTECGEQSFSREETHAHTYQRTTFFEETRSEFEERSETRSESERPGADVGELEAEVVVLASSTAAIEDYSVVLVSGNAQRDLRAISLANATTATVGSAANVLGTARAGPGTAAAATARVSQSNVFVQGFR